MSLHTGTNCSSTSFIRLGRCFRSSPKSNCTMRVHFFWHSKWHTLFPPGRASAQISTYDVDFKSAVQRCDDYLGDLTRLAADPRVLVAVRQLLVNYFHRYEEVPRSLKTDEQANRVLLYPYIPKYHSKRNGELSVPLPTRYSVLLYPLRLVYGQLRYWRHSRDGLGRVDILAFHRLHLAPPAHNPGDCAGNFFRQLIK